MSLCIGLVVIMRLPCKCQSLSRVRLFVTPWPETHQAPLSMEFSSNNAGVGCLFFSQDKYGRITAPRKTQRVNGKQARCPNQFHEFSCTFQDLPRDLTRVRGPLTGRLVDETCQSVCHITPCSQGAPGDSKEIKDWGSLGQSSRN